MKINTHIHEKGQVIVLIMLAMVMLAGFAALAIDGSALYARRRAAQNAADNSSLAGAYAICKENNVGAAIQQVANQNGFFSSGPNNSVVYFLPPSSGVGAGDATYVEVIITSEVPSNLAQLVYGGPLVTTVRSVGHCIEGTSGGIAAPVIALSETCTNTIDLSGGDNVFDGGLHTNNDMNFGTPNTVNGELTYVSSVNGDPSDPIYDPPPPDNPVQVSPITDPLGYNILDYAPGGVKADEAALTGQYYSCECKMDMGWLIGQGLYNSSTHILDDGLYFTTEQIELSDSLIDGSVTLVSEEAKISISGSLMDLTPYIDGLLAFANVQLSGSSQCDESVIQMSGGENEWSGVVYAPNGQIEFSGSDNTTFNGALVGYTVKINGSEVGFSFDPDFFPTAADELEIAE